MIRIILSFVLLVGTGIIFLMETISNNSDSNPLLLLTIISTVLFIAGVFYHVRGFRSS